MRSEAFDNTYLDSMRRVGDEEVDPLVHRVLAGEAGEQPSGRLRYNLMMDLADRIVAAPSLQLVPDSTLNQHLEQIPGDVRASFTPMQAPEWVDPHKLELGATLWSENRLAMLAVLYAYSLPACYLIEKGIPALYDTAKLREPRYLFQRIYETGLMLEAVMGEGGIRVVEDMGEDGTRRRYLWGEGFVTAKKVRFLHASMRYMLTHRHEEAAPGGGESATNVAESLARDAGPWDTDALGVPVNQEDLAYTLLTFGYALPRGLAHWGAPVEPEQREAFLHLWRVVGHVMGIRDELTTDSWDEATRFFDLVKSRQGHRSDQGVALTRTLIGFLSAYMPSHEALGRRISALMMMDQLGEDDARKLLDEDLLTSAKRGDRRALYAFGRGAVRAYYLVRTLVLSRVPTLGAFLGNLVDGSSEQLLHSWRAEYVRRPFGIPADSEHWKRKAGVDAAFMARLRAWRRRLFLNLGVAIGALFVAAFSVLAMLPAGLLEGTSGLKWPGLLCLVSLLGAVFVMKWRLPAVFDARPQPAPVSTP